jgi:molybdate transport system permease protein
MDDTLWPTICFTLGVATLSTLLIVPFGVPLAWLLARRNWPGKALVETLVTLPLVLPPVATGLILLELFGRRGPLGGFLERHGGWEIAFTWKAVVLAMGVMSFPLLVRAARIAFEQVNPRLEQVARTLGAGSMRIGVTITLPLAARGIVAGCVLAFARALGEFGATVLVAGIIPGATATLSTAIYQHIQLGQDREAYLLVGVAAVLAFGAVGLSEYLLRRRAAA